MLEQIFEKFISKSMEKLTNYIHNTITTKNDYKLTLQTLERNLRLLTAKATDVEEEVKNAELLGKRKRKREVENWLTEVDKLQSEFAELEGDMESQGFISKFFGGAQAKELCVKVDELVEQSRHFGELALDIYETKGVPFLTVRRLVGKRVEENLERVWKFLVNDGVQSVGIHGMGGVGKTTLVKHIHNWFLEKTQQPVFWVTVSQVFSVKNLQDEIAHVVHLDLSDEHNEDKRASRLNQELSQRKNFVLILDDVWKKIKLENVGDPLSLQGCRLIITTRSLEVCNQIGCQQVVQVNTVNKWEAWDLFRETLGDRMTLTPAVEKIAKSMSKRCCGLPLGIITTAGSMKGKSDIHEWINALEEFKESTMSEDGNGDKVFEILKCSFDRMDQGEKRCSQYTNLQNCFLFCCLYPEDYKIDRKKLIDEFISAGYLDKRSRKKQEHQGHTMLNKLVSVCLLESYNPSCVKMHDLVRAMALKITKGKFMRMDGLHHSLKGTINEEGYWTKDLEKISLINIGIRDIPSGWSPSCPKLSTLLLLNNSFLEHFPGSFFLKINSLHTLDLSYTMIRELPDSLSNLGSLQALHTGGCKHLRYFPYLGNLKKLKELVLSNTCIRGIPRGMEELVNLEYLKIDTEHLETLPRGLLCKFSNLQCLYLPYHIQARVNEIERLEQLEEFRGLVQHVSGFNRIIGCQQCKLQGAPVLLSCHSGRRLSLYRIRRDV